MKDIHILPTSEEIMSKHSKRYGEITNNPRAICMATESMDAMIEFAKLHVQAALKAVSENAELDYWKGDCQLCGSNVINKESILNAYPLTNIK